MAVSLTQSKLVASGTGANSCSATGTGYNSNTAAGSLLVCVIWSQDHASHSTTELPIIAAPTTAGFTWSLAQWSYYEDDAGQRAGSVAIFYIENAASMSSGTSTTVSATKTTQSGSTIGIEFACFEFAGVAASSSFNAAAARVNQTSSPTGAGNLVTTGTALILVASAGEPGSNTTAGSGYTLGTSSINDPIGQTQYILNQTSGTIVTAFAGLSGTHWGCAATAFLSAAQATGGKSFGYIIGL